MTEDFRVLHAERQRLLQQWESTVKALRQRDEQISQTTQRYDALKDSVLEQRAQLTDSRSTLSSQQDQNRDLQRSIETHERQLLRVKSTLTQAQQTLEHLENEVHSTKHVVQVSKFMTQYTWRSSIRRYYCWKNTTSYCEVAAR
jgi:chromosome segregation ATPase